MRTGKLSNGLSDAIGNIKDAKIPADIAFAFREAGDVLVCLFAPMMPHLAEESWQVLGGQGFVSDAGWPQIERDLLVEDSITLPVQVNGKKRGEVTVARQELWRSATGRRTRDDVRSFSWTVDPEPYIERAWKSPSFTWVEDR